MQQQISYISATIAASIIRYRQSIQWHFRKRWKAIPTTHPTKRIFISRRKKNQITRCSQSLIHISRLPPFKVPTKHTNSTWYHNSHFTPTIFRHHNATFLQYTPSLKPIEVKWITDVLQFRISCYWGKVYLMQFRNHCFIMYLLIYETLKHTFVWYISMFNKKPKSYSFSDIMFQNFVTSFFWIFAPYAQ